MTRRTSISWALAVALLASACAGESPATTGARQTGDAGTTQTAPDDATAPDGASTQTGGELVIGAAGRWGTGRAIASATADDGTMAIVTTTSLWLAPGDGDLVDLGGDPVERMPVVAISDDAAIVAAVTVDPPTLDWHDAATGELLASAPLPAGGLPQHLRFVPGTTTVVAETDVGPFVWTEPPTDGAPPVTPGVDSIAGASAVRASGVAITPLIGTRSLAVHRDGVTVLVELDLPETASAQRVASSPAGPIVAIEASVGATEFDRPDQLVLVDPQRYEVQATIELGRDVPSDGWDVIGDVGDLGDLVAVAAGNRIELFDATGAAVRTLEYDSDVGIARITGTAAGMVTMLTDNRVLFWPAETWEPEPLHEGGRVLNRFTVSADRSIVSVTDSLGAIRTWSGVDGTELGERSDFAIGELTDVAIAADGTVAAGTTVGRVVIGDSSLSDIDQLESSDVPVRVDSVAFRPGGDELATGRAERRSDLAFDDTLTLWEVEAGTPRLRTGGEEEDVPGCAFFFHRIAYTADGAVLANAKHDRTVGIVDTETGEVMLRLPPRTGSILDLAFAADDSLLVVSADDNRIEVHDTSDWSVVSTFESDSGGYSAIDTLPDGTTLVVADVTGGLSAIDVRTGERLLTFDGLLPPRPTEVAVDPTGSLVASPLPDDAVGVWSTATGELLATLTGHTGGVNGLAFSSDGSLLVSAASDGTLRSWTIDRA